ncbi:unnamed protein product [Cuscuta europaea]|uniref:RNase H type-1 domain-containing protein n=1 Tax=Cuscuta europaea TaxID=41803 RepID=A0A9P0ZM24_CUSEU|nr:unnamed protein product [Cuscuta europaea]
MGGSRQQTGGQSNALWCKPGPGCWKLNVDAASGVHNGGIGWCLRDEEGEFIAGAARKLPGSLTPLMAELVDIREALRWLKDFGGSSVEVGSDSLRAISEILNGSSCSAVGLLREDISDLANFYSNISFSHVKRSANKPAHLLARAARSSLDSQFWFNYPPSFIVSALANDLINAN